MMGSQVMLGGVIAKIIIARFPMDKKLFLEGPILDPIKTHVDGLQPFLFDGVVGKTISV